MVHWEAGLTGNRELGSYSHCIMQSPISTFREPTRCTELIQMELSNLPSFKSELSSFIRLKWTSRTPRSPTTHAKRTSGYWSSGQPKYSKMYCLRYSSFCGGRALLSGTKDLGPQSSGLPPPADLGLFLHSSWSTTLRSIFFINKAEIKAACFMWIPSMW